jgi:hypothetical protein
VNPERDRSAGRHRGALGSADKTLADNPGGHLDLPRASVEESAAWPDRKPAKQ